MNDHDFILGRLPLAIARSYIQSFWMLKYRVHCEKPGTENKKAALRQPLQ
jgi:hypothetical protein